MDIRDTHVLIVCREKGPLGDLGLDELSEGGVSEEEAFSLSLIPKPVGGSWMALFTVHVYCVNLPLAFPL